MFATRSRISAETRLLLSSSSRASVSRRIRILSKCGSSQTHRMCRICAVVVVEIPNVAKTHGSTAPVADEMRSPIRHIVCGSTLSSGLRSHNARHQPFMLHLPHWAASPPLQNGVKTGDQRLAEVQYGGSTERRRNGRPGAGSSQMARDQSARAVGSGDFLFGQVGICHCTGRGSINGADDPPFGERIMGVKQYRSHRWRVRAAGDDDLLWDCVTGSVKIVVVEPQSHTCRPP